MLKGEVKMQDPCLGSHIILLQLIHSLDAYPILRKGHKDDLQEDRFGKSIQ